MPTYTKKFKVRMVQRMLGPNALSATALAEETGISQSTLSAWLRELRTISVPMDDAHKPPTVSPAAVPTTTPASPTRARSPQEQLRILARADSLSGDELGVMLRREGLHAAELEAWRSAVVDALQGRTPAPTQATSAADRKRIQHLERELARKEKALAEAAALLLLQKKVRAYLGDEDERTDDRSER